MKVFTEQERASKSRDVKRSSAPSVRFLVDESSSGDLLVQHWVLAAEIREFISDVHRTSDQFVHVLTGTVVVHEGSRAETLGKGDSVLLQSAWNGNYLVENISDGDAELLVVRKNVSCSGQQKASKKKAAFEKRATTRELLSVLSVTNCAGQEKVVEISHNSRLFKLARYIFYIFGIDARDADFEYTYLRPGTISYVGHTVFRLPKNGEEFPVEVGNIRTSRIDSALFEEEHDLVLRLNGSPHEEFVIKNLRYEHPEARRLYPREGQVTSQER